MEQSLESEIAVWIGNLTDDKKALEKTLKVIKGAAFEIPVVICSEMIEYNPQFFEDSKFKIGDEILYSLTLNFSARHYPALLSFVQRYEAICEAGWKAEEKIDHCLERQRRIFKDDYEYGDVPGEIVIYADRIEVSAIGYRENFKSMLPRGGKYQGSGTGIWRYPRSLKIKERFEQFGSMWNGCPVLYADESECPYFQSNQRN